MKPLSILFLNPHTSIAGGVYLFAKVGAELGAVWFPAHAGQFKTTADIVEGAAVTYGLLAAGDASSGLPKPDQAPTLPPDVKPPTP